MELKNICIVKNYILPSKARRRRQCKIVLVAVGRVLNLSTIISVDLTGLVTNYFYSVDLSKSKIDEKSAHSTYTRHQGWRPLF